MCLVFRFCLICWLHWPDLKEHRDDSTLIKPCPFRSSQIMTAESLSQFSVKIVQDVKIRILKEVITMGN